MTAAAVIVKFLDPIGFSVTKIAGEKRNAYVACPRPVLSAQRTGRGSHSYYFVRLHANRQSCRAVLTRNDYLTLVIHRLIIQTTRLAPMRCKMLITEWL